MIIVSGVGFDDQNSDYFFQQKLDPTLDFEAALLTIQASDYLQAKGCLDASTRLAKNLMTPDTALWGWVFARHFNLVDLGRWSWTYITFNFKEVSLSDDFTGLEYKEMKVLLGSGEWSLIACSDYLMQVNPI